MPISCRRTVSIERGAMKLLIPFLTFLLPLTVSLAEGPCEVRVHLSDDRGNSVEAAEVKVLGAGTAVKVTPDKPFRIGSGAYTLQVTAPGFEPATLPIVIDQLHQVIAVSLRLGALEGPVPACAVYGRITSPVPVSYVRLMELFGSRSVVPLEESRSFDFRGVSCGTYLLILIGPKSCLGISIVKATPLTGELKIAPVESAEECMPLGRQK